MTDCNQRLSENIASLLGPILIVVSLSETINLDIWSENVPPVTYLNGLIFFAAGLAVIRFHNFWRADWTVSVTIIGWLLTAAGLFRLSFLDAEQAGQHPGTYLLTGSLFLLGLFLTVNAYR